jgi:GGDEF domain-containing protein
VPHDQPISFGSDGTYDLLTNAHSPRFFYNALDREIALAIRALEQNRIYPLSLLLVRLSPTRKISLTGRNSFQLLHPGPLSHTPYESQLINIAYLIERGIREGDLFARCYESAFVILSRNSNEQVESMKERFANLLPQEVELVALTRGEDETRKSLIARLDNEFEKLVRREIAGI